jgi:hypothetical protein
MPLLHIKVVAKHEGKTDDRKRKMGAAKRSGSF